MKLGSFEVHTVETGFFKLDGGAMFGSVPKKLWERKIRADEDNRIPMAARVLLVRDHKSGRNLLIDTGNGHKWDEKFLKIYGLDYSQTNLEKSLSELGLKPEDITDVVLTHLHFDHAGGATKWDENKNVIPTFPNATYYVQKKNFEWASSPNSREAASYLPENFKPLDDLGQLKICDGVSEFEKTIQWPGISGRISDGHTIGLFAPVIQVENETFFYPTDMIPTSAHVPVPWVMGYDIHVIKLLEEKEEVLKEAKANDWILVYEHDPVVKASRVKEGKKYLEADTAIDL